MAAHDSAGEETLVGSPLKNKFKAGFNDYMDVNV